MKKLVATATLLAAVLAPLPAITRDDAPFDRHSEDTLTLAVFGDWPYNDILLNSAHLLIDSVNSDPKVRLVLHVGDIHSGSQPCTGAGLVPPPTTSDPGYNQAVFDRFAQFKDPFVYTPGDNEWTDCHSPRSS